MADAPNKKNAPKKKARDEFQEDEIFQAPAITRDPTSRQAKLGAKVVIRVIATGKPLPSYQWYHNGQKIIGAVSDRLTISKTRRQAAGSYHCEAKNFVGKATSRIAMLSFFTLEIPKLVIGPDRTRVEEGKPFTLKVTSPTPDKLRDYKIFWIFNGMRIKGAFGPELNISAMKKKYEGEYKAMIATGGMLETSNVAVLAMSAQKAAHAPATPRAARPARGRPADMELESEGAALKMDGGESMDDVLAQEPTRELEPPLPPPHKPVAGPAWEEFLFNPEDEDEGERSPPMVAPSPGSEIFGNTSPGAAAERGAPLSQLKTQDLIRELAAQGGASELIEKAKTEDDGVLDLSAESFAEPAAPSVDEASRLLEMPAPAPAHCDDPSGLLEPLAAQPEANDPMRLIEAARAAVAAPVSEDPSGLLEALGSEAPYVTDDPSGLIQALELREPVAPPKPAVPHLREVPPLPSEKAAPSQEEAPGTSKKKRMLEGLLGRLQAKKPPQAA